MEINKTQKNNNESGNMTMESFRASLSKISPLEALQNFKNLLDRSIAAGMFKGTESVIIMFQSLEILHACYSAETGTIDKNEPDVMPNQ